MKRPLLMAFLAGLITTPFLFILANVSTATGSVAAVTLAGLLPDRTFGIRLEQGKLPVVLNVRGEAKPTKTTQDAPSNLGEVSVIIVGKDTDPGYGTPTKPVPHTHDLDDGIFGSSMSNEERSIHNGYAHCWVQIGGKWTQIHC